MHAYGTGTRGARAASGMADGMDAGLDLGLEYLKALSGPNKSLLTFLTHSLLLVHKDIVPARHPRDSHAYATIRVCAIEHMRSPGL